MFNRMSALCLVLGGLVGLAVAGPSVRAQSSGTVLPFVVDTGDVVGLTFEKGTILPEVFKCRVAELQADWIRCTSTEPLPSTHEQHWYRLKRVIQVTRLEK
jgi:hypothetical protein